VDAAGEVVTRVALVALVALAACGKSKAESEREAKCRLASTSAADYMRVLIQHVQRSAPMPPEEKAFDEAPQGDPDRVFLETSLVESSQLQTAWLDVERAHSAALAAAREPMTKELTDVAKAFDGVVDPAGAARRALDQVAKLEAIEGKRATDLHAISTKQAALLARMDTKIAAGIKDEQLGADLAALRKTVELAVEAGQLSEKLPDSYAVDKLALEDVIKSCAK
jgi:hypothetical protein